MHTTSQTLLERLQQPDQPDAWTRFVNLYTPLLAMWARRQGLQEADAEDLAQEVLVKLVRVMPSYERGEGQSFRGWLSQISKNQCHDFRRRRATRALPGADGLSGVNDRELATDLDEIEYRRLLVDQAQKLIRPDFNETTWAAYTGVAVEGRSATEVATGLKMSVNAVYTARHRVLARLREELDGFLD
jgi:RNA polymerase sigma factor (sigma-70 family)